MMLVMAIEMSFALLASDSVVARDSTRSLTVPPWFEAAAISNTEFFTSRLSAWQVHGVAIRYRGKNASHGVEGLTVRRFDKWNSAVAIEESRTLGRGAYLAGRAQFAPGATIMAKSDLSLTLFQSLGSGWELTPSVRVLSFSEESVRILGLGAGRYLGLWFVSGRMNEARQRGEQTFAASAQMRRYQTDASPNFVDAVVAFGNEAVILGPSDVAQKRTSSVAARGQKLLTRNVGFSVGVTYDTMASLPDRSGVNLSTFVRW